MSDVTRCHKSVIGCVITMALWMLGEDCREQLCSAKVRRQTAQRRVGLGRSSLLCKDILAQRCMRWLFLQSICRGFPKSKDMMFCNPKIRLNQGIFQGMNPNYYTGLQDNRCNIYKIPTRFHPFRHHFVLRFFSWQGEEDFDSCARKQLAGFRWMDSYRPGEKKVQSCYI